MAKGPSHGDWDTALEAGQLYEAELAALRLREAGIEARVIDQSYRQEPLPSVRALSLVRVLVPADRVADARRVLAEGEALPEDAEPTTEETGSEREVP
jgi:Putative prokaryotic signal transducing protein